MTRETIKEYILQVKSQDGTEALYNRWEPDILVEVINEIYNDHEAQLKEYQEDIYELEQQCRKLLAHEEHSLEVVNELESELKAKDEKLQQLDDAYASVVYDFESAVMEIERLKAQLSSVHNLMYRNGYSDAIDCYDTFGKFNTKHKPNAKSRSIVAMLFWEWRKYNSNFKNEENSFIQGRASKTKELFYKAHKMLKEKQ